MSVIMAPKGDKGRHFDQATYFPPLDGLRAIAVLAVIGFHARLPLFANGSYGVDLFFALSGFLITTLLLRERATNGRVMLARFYWRRTSRIFPAYYAVLALYVALTWRFARGTPEGKSFFIHLPVFATYLTNWFVNARADGGRVIFLFAWSLAVEEQFYLVWPSVLRWTRGLVAPVATALLAASLSWYFTAIGFGCVLALLAHDTRTRPATQRALSHPLALPLSLAGVLLVLLIGRGWPIAIPALIAAVVVGAAACGTGTPLGRALSIPPLRYIGRVSYGVYLLHTLALHVAERLLPAPGYAAAALGALLAIGAASVSFYAFERPIQRWARGESALAAPAGMATLAGAVSQ